MDVPKYSFRSLTLGTQVWIFWPKSLPPTVRSRTGHFPDLKLWDRPKITGTNDFTHTNTKIKSPIPFNLRYVVTYLAEFI